MKLNRKGFMLAEVAVVAVVVATVLVTLFTGLSSVSSAYEIRNSYYDVDSLYAAMEINDTLVRNQKIDTLITDNTIKKLLDDGDTYKVEDFMSFYQNTGYDISKSYFVPYTKDKILLLKEVLLKEENINNTFKDYIDYLSGHLDFSAGYKYMIIVERTNVNNSDDCYYYGLKVKE